jgi:hypothetical protein
MAEPQQPGTTKSKESHLFDGLISLLFFLWGLGGLFFEESNNTFKLCLHLLMIVVGGLGIIRAIWLSLRKSA